VGVTLTGGVRDPDPNATCAAIVVQRSDVQIEDCLIRDNLGDSSVVAVTVTGVMGVAGREGSQLNVRRNRILRNSWDGIALYRGAQAVIQGNLIDGEDLATGSRLGGGRGVGIGVTWDAVAEIRFNLVRRYWKGIGIFVDAQATVEENVIEEVATWGIAFWDAGRGRPVGRIAQNVLYQTGACGIAITRQAGGVPLAGYCRENLLMRTGQNLKYDDPEAYCRQCPVAVQAYPPEFELRDNWGWDNRIVGCPEGPDDLEWAIFIERALPQLKRLMVHPTLRNAQFFKDLSVRQPDFPSSFNQ
jgi:hypothetical protein